MQLFWPMLCKWVTLVFIFEWMFCSYYQPHSQHVLLTMLSSELFYILNSNEQNIILQLFLLWSENLCHLIVIKWHWLTWAHSLFVLTFSKYQMSQGPMDLFFNEKGWFHHSTCTEIPVYFSGTRMSSPRPFRMDRSRTRYTSRRRGLITI